MWHTLSTLCDARCKRRAVLLYCGVFCSILHRHFLFYRGPDVTLKREAADLLHSRKVAHGLWCSGSLDCNYLALTAALRETDGALTSLMQIIVLLKV